MVSPLDFALTFPVSKSKENAVAKGYKTANNELQVAIRHRFLRSLHAEDQQIEGIVPQKTKYQRNFSISTIIIAANNRELVDQCYSFEENSQELSVSDEAALHI